MKNSCGALFYAYDTEGKLGIILGEEGGKEEWLPFKGCAEENETFENAAIREIKEETCGLVTIPEIVLEHKFSTKRKNYYIGLCQVPYKIVDDFKKIVVDETRREFKEKKELKFFLLNEVLKVPSVHSISRASIRYYWDRLNYLAHNPPAENERMRCHGITKAYAEKIKKLIDNELTYRKKNNLDDQNSTDENSDENNCVKKTNTFIHDFEQYKHDNINKINELTGNSNITDEELFELFGQQRPNKKNQPKPNNHNKKKNINRRNISTSKPIRYNMRFTPNMEKSVQSNLVWRKPEL